MSTYSFLDVSASLAGAYQGLVELGCSSANAEEGITVTMTEAKTP